MNPVIHGCLAISTICALSAHVREPLNPLQSRDVGAGPTSQSGTVGDQRQHETNALRDRCAGQHQCTPFYNALPLTYVVASIKKILIGCSQAFAQRRLHGPPQCGELGNIKQLARRSIGTAVFEHQLPVIATISATSCAKSLTPTPCGSNMKEALIGIMLDYEDAGVAEVVRCQKFALGLAGAPNYNLFRALHFGLMKSPMSAAATWLFSG